MFKSSLLHIYQARVDNIHVHGYSKTKDSIIESSIRLMFTSNSFHNVSFIFIWVLSFYDYYRSIINYKLPK